jgi:thioredoxin reductase (NADPH)
MGADVRATTGTDSPGEHRPAIVVIDDDADSADGVERELRDRYERHYRVLFTPSHRVGCTMLESLAADGDEVALVLAGQELSGGTERQLLDAARRLHPHASRCLLIEWGRWGDQATGDAVFDAIARGRIDHYVLRPSTSPDEQFHQAVSGLLLDWAEARRAAPHTIHVVGRSWSGRAYELREVLSRCAIPHSFSLADSDEGRALVERAGAAAQFPLVVLPDGRFLADPTDAELTVASGSSVDPDRMDFDLVIVGAGPAGLSAAVYGASEGFSTLVVDQGGLGGQATSSSLIRNYLGFPRGISGRHLAQRAYDQAWVFGASFTFMQGVTELGRDADGLFVTLATSGRVHTRAVLLATGASWRRLGVPALEALNGAGVFYGGSAVEASGMAGRRVYVVGGANSAGQAALHLARYACSVTLVVRAESLAAGMSSYLVGEIEATNNVHVRTGAEVLDGGGDGWLERLVLRDRRTGSETTVAADGLFLMIGARPRTEWLPAGVERDDQGFVVTGSDLGPGRWSLPRAAFPLETSMPRVLAAGDVRHGSVKRVASAVGEGSIAVQQLHRLFAAEGLHPRGRPSEPVGVAHA